MSTTTTREAPNLLVRQALRQRNRQLCEASSLFEIHKIKEPTHQPSEWLRFFNTDIEPFIRRREGQRLWYQLSPR
jgi:hypothetical protein